MAKPRKRNMGKYIKGNVDEQSELGALAGKTLISTNFDEVTREAARISSLVASWALEGFTVGPDDGPILVGVAHSDYTDAEIEQVIENSGAWDLGNKIAQEQAKRLVRRVGMFRVSGQATGIMTLNEGQPIKTKLNWQLNTGATLKVWGYNTGSGTLITGAVIALQGHVNLWQKA